MEKGRVLLSSPPRQLIEQARSEVKRRTISGAFAKKEFGKHAVTSLLLQRAAEEIDEAKDALYMISECAKTMEGEVDYLDDPEDDPQENPEAEEDIREAKVDFEDRMVNIKLYLQAASTEYKGENGG